jgi:threonine dehydrogenase-like Zn-dependent dehydrogenase
MHDLITITPLVAIGGQCNYCKIDLDATCTIYQGRAIYFNCDGCGHEYHLTLEEGNY